eukprot:tig00000241_g20883.t1
MQGGYYDVDAILSEEERFPVVTSNEGRNLGHLDTADPYSRKHLPVGAKLELPLWLGLAMATKNHISFATPKSFSQRTCEDVEADPTVINLQEKSPFWYENGMKLVKHQKDKANLVSVMQTAFRERYKLIFDRAYSSQNRDVSSFVSKLTSFERVLFRTGQAAAVSAEQWHTQGSDFSGRGTKRKLDAP